MSPLAQAEIKSIRNKSVNRPVLRALSSLKGHYDWAPAVDQLV